MPDESSQLNLAEDHLSAEVTEIPCLVLTHGRDDINRTSLLSIIECDPRLDIDVVHNPSSSEDGSFIDFARECAAAGTIRSFTLFEANISNNALLLFLLDHRDRYSADCVIVTDGDIVAPSSLIDEQIAIFDRHPDVFACGLRLDASVWDDSLVIKNDFIERFNTSQFEAADYLNTATGMWMTMFRGPELAAIAKTIRDNSLRLTDANMKQLGAALFQKQWVATKKSMGRELNRERPDYHDTKAVSTRHFGDHSPEPQGSRYATWNHDLVAAAVEWREGGRQIVNFTSLPPTQPRFRGAIEDDPVVRNLESGELQPVRGYLANHLVAATSPGLAFIVSDEKCPTGLPFLQADRSALFISTLSEPGRHLGALPELDLGPVLLTIEAEQCRSILTTLARFVGAGSLIHGIVFIAEEVRRLSADGLPPQAGLLPPSLRSCAARLAKRRNAAEATDVGAGGEIERFVARLWTDEMVATWFGAKGNPIQFSHSVKNPNLSYFRLKL